MKKIIEKIKSLFEDKKKRYLYMFLFMLPFIIAIAIFGIIAFKDVKTLLSLVTDVETKEEYVINNGDYQLRDNATDYQVELFTELKGMIKGSLEHTDVELAESICKNYIADFYTWSNKAGQYDVGGLYYIYTPQKEIIYIQARDEFYKYINDYINRYGKENLLEVENIETSGRKMSDKYALINIDDGSTIEEFDAYSVTCSWTYKEKEKFNTSGYTKKLSFVVINNNGRFEIAEVNE